MTDTTPLQTTDEKQYYIPPKAGSQGKDEKLPDIRDIRKENDWLGLAYMIVAFFVLIAAFQLYFLLQDLIRTWISDQFVPLFSACYYLAVIIVGIWLIRGYVRRP